MYENGNLKPDTNKRRGKRRMLLFLICAAVLLSPAAAVSADIGPKPSVQITFTGMEGEEYYGTLLSLYDSTGGCGTGMTGMPAMKKGNMRFGKHLWNIRMRTGFTFCRNGGTVPKIRS